jgi:hypothetical protein
LEIDEAIEDCENTNAANLLEVLTPEKTKEESEELEFKQGLAFGAALLAGMFLLSSLGGGVDASVVTAMIPAVKAAANGTRR